MAGHEYYYPDVDLTNAAYTSPNEIPTDFKSIDINSRFGNAAAMSGTNPCGNFTTSSNIENNDNIDMNNKMDMNTGGGMLGGGVGKSHFMPCDRPNTAMHYVRNQEYAKPPQFRPQTSAGVRPSKTQRVQHVSNPEFSAPPACNCYGCNHCGCQSEWFRWQLREMALWLMAALESPPPPPQQKKKQPLSMPKQRSRQTAAVCKQRRRRPSCPPQGPQREHLNGLQDDCRRRECKAWYGNPNLQCKPTIKDENPRTSQTAPSLVVPPATPLTKAATSPAISTNKLKTAQTKSAGNRLSRQPTTRLARTKV